MLNLSPFEAWLMSFEEERECVLATILPINPSQPIKAPYRLFISGSRETSGDLGDEDINLKVTEIASRKLNETNPKSETRVFTLPNGNEIHVFIDVYIPPVELMIFGAGHDAVPVAKYAVSLGFKTTVVDQREFYNNEDRFPGTNRIIAKTCEFQEKIKIGRRTYIVVMNHHIERDQETLKFVLRSPSPYIGVLGPRSRRIRMIEGLGENGVFFDEKELERMYSPIGLDIGAATPEEIALSILAEVVAKRNGHKGGFLQGSDHIHRAAASVKEPV
jgi:xanthine/CO dehydrogenase XdhC/CoxF family maturation factor